MVLEKVILRKFATVLLKVCFHLKAGVDHDVLGVRQNCVHFCLRDVQHLKNTILRSSLFIIVKKVPCEIPPMEKQ